jgi:UDP-glucose-4-epimerase GalE
VQTPLTEEHSCKPLSPYGESKLQVEQRLEQLKDKLSSVALRYFNAAGADPAGRIGEQHIPETHLIPLAFQVASGRRDMLPVHGEDYETPDGTCIRDFVHVEDIAEAHLLAMNYLLEGGRERVFNLGTGEGYSVREVIEAAGRITGKSIPITLAPRRPGDPAVLVADGSRARQVLGWQPRFSNLDLILKHAWAWEQKLAKIG